MFRYLFLLPVLIISTCLSAQQSSVYENLPVGKYAVGFKIITIIDSSRVSKPEFNYIGEKNEGGRESKITIHLWYPAKANSSQRNLTYGDYCYNALLTSTNETITPERKTREINNRKRSVEGWFGKTTDDAWTTLTATTMLASPEAIPLNERFPLLIGTLRSLSTSITNELLASNGYVVAMVYNAPFSSFSTAALSLIPDMQYAIKYLINKEPVDESKIGAFGFSGSGFMPVLFSMFDYRIKALADIESGIYMEGLHQGLSGSNYYKPSKLRIPFLHIFSRDLSKQEKHISEFEDKAKFSKRYQLLLNQPALHHWDFASEGYTSCIILKNRGAAQSNIQQSFEIASIYLLNFFNAELKNDQLAQAFLANKPALKANSGLWDITAHSPVKPAPDKDEFEYIIRIKGINEALGIVKNTLKNDSSTNITQGFVLNTLGYTLLTEKKYAEAIGVFKLNTELHPTEANFFDSLAEGYEISGDKDGAKKTSDMILAILSKKTTLTDAEKSLKEMAEKRSKL